ncbi:MAG: cyclic lactone autoinducer peptide [Lachnospiraceae bacterium]|nr:cyclic lactone autoinducer peptide [Lachnospiraceae bacterium]
MARILTSASNKTLSAAANSRCMLIYHQPKQPEGLKRFRKF